MSEVRSKRRWPVFSTIVMLVGLLALGAAGVLFVLTYLEADVDERLGSGPETVTAFGPELDAVLTAESGAPPPQPTTTPASASSAPVERLVIPRFDVDAGVITLGVDEDGIMEAPEGPWDAAWYDFTARPGGGSNAVFSGHVDWYNAGPDGGPGPAVFWHLKDLEEGDRIEVYLEDGTMYTYRTISRQQVFPDEVDAGAVVGPSQREIITLITCGGTFDPTTRHYDQRTIVQAERVVEPATG